MNPSDFDLPWMRGAAAEAYARFARELAAACAPGFASAEALRGFGAAQFTSAGAPFAANAAAVDGAAAFARAADAPPLGATREQQLRWQAWSRAAQEFVAAAQAHATLLGEIGAVAGERYAARLAAPDALRAPLRVLFDDWIECAESAWQEAAHGERFCTAQARLLNAFVAWRAAAQAIAADTARAVDVPTRSEVDELQRTVRELQRELAELRGAARSAEPESAPERGAARTPRAMAEAERPVVRATKPKGGRAAAPRRRRSTPR